MLYFDTTKFSPDELAKILELQSNIEYRNAKLERKIQEIKEEYDKMLSELKNQTSQNEQEGP